MHDFGPRSRNEFVWGAMYQAQDDRSNIPAGTVVYESLTLVRTCSEIRRSKMSRKHTFVGTCVVVVLCVSSVFAQDRGVIDKYCVTCHNERLKTAGLSLDAADFVRPSNGADVWEKVIRKVRAEMMPPVGAARPDK